LRLKKVIILGFKSFADKTTLEFQPGITGIVGPNGCGKSNIADAFRWVMGEQSAKSMRGSKMPDVIFAGTNQRKPLNFAEVTLVFDDIQGELPVEYEEIAITRRLHRSGESDYFINGHDVRLKDIHNLFLDSGIGRNAFAIFEQGKIDQIINYGPLERRYIFEEAAGILRFLQRKREALRKLEQSELNATRVRDIHQEVEKQIIVLEQQSEKARLFKEKKSEFETLEKQLFIGKWDALEKQQTDIKQKEQIQQKEIKQLSEQQQTLHNRLEETKALLEVSESNLKVDSEKAFKARSTKEMKAKERSDNQERYKEAVAREKECAQEIATIKTESTERLKELKKNQKRHKELEEVRLAADSKMKELRDKEKGLDNNLNDLRRQQQQTYQQRLKCIQDENSIDIEIKQNKVRIENAHERIATSYQRRDKLAQQMELCTHQTVEKKQLMQELSEAIDKQKAAFIAMEEELTQVSEQIEIAQTGFEKTLSELTEHKARQKVIVRLKEEMEGLSNAGKKLMQESANPKSPLYGKVKGLYEFLQPKSDTDPNIGTALTASMRSYAQTLVVQTSDDFEACVAFATKNNLKDFSLFCMEQLSAKQKATAEKKEIQPLLPLLTDHPLAQHFLSHVTIAQNAKESLTQMKQEKVAERECWNKDGSFVDRHRVVFYSGDNENSLFMRSSELTRLEKKIKEKESHRQTIEAAIRTLQQKRTTLHTQRVETDKAMRKEEMKLIEINFAIQRLNGDLEKGRLECLQIEQEVKSLEETVRKLASTISDLEKKKSEAQAKTTALQQQLVTLEETLKKEIDKLKVEQQAMQEQQTAYQKIVDDNHRVLQTIHLHEIQEKESQQHAQRLEQEITRSREFQSKMSQHSKDCTSTLEEVEKTLTQVTGTCRQLEELIARHKQTIKQLESDIRQESDKLKKRESEIHQLNILSAQRLSTRQNIEKELQERYGLLIDELRANCLPINGPVDQLESRVRILRQEIEAFGDVNMTSIEEHDKHQVRYRFLNEQIDDMQSTKDELVKIIAELDDESRKIFKETFEVINTNFKKNFSILFNGGEADLQFTETEDVLEAGIEIIAKPPGKQMRSIHLLSGGEKCLTALALLFAIFEVKPSPFCILDEVDAPLDDSNVERFANVMKQFIDKCQFIIITHNKRTMSIADMLFGVSMQEKGVSKILSIEFSRETELEESLILS
jgi:chromosome segregation protein